jgi:hypothetical protein
LNEIFYLKIYLFFLNSPQPGGSNRKIKKYLVLAFSIEINSIIIKQNIITDIVQEQK